MYIYIYLNSTYRFISFHVLAKVEPCASIRAAVFISDACIRPIPWSPWSLFNILIVVSADLSLTSAGSFSNQQRGSPLRKKRNAKSGLRLRGHLCLSVPFCVC